jgi:hypothetical protein
MASSDNKAVTDLAAKAGGVLIRQGAVWTYPGAPMDPSGTNMRLPLEYVTDAQVSAALEANALVAATVAPGGFVTAVQVAGDAVRPVVSTALAGTAEASTELRVGSRPSIDAGTVPASAADAERQAAAYIASVNRRPEGAELRAVDPAAVAKEPVTADVGARRGR